MEIFGFFSALLIGLVLGLIGSGGSILTVPIFVYILGVSPVLATSYSLFVVGFTAMIGVIKNYQNNMVDIKTGVIFAIPAFIGVFFARKFILPEIPHQIISFNSFLLTKDIAIMLLFAIIMFLAAFFMIKGRTETNSKKEKNYAISGESLKYKNLKNISYIKRKYSNTKIIGGGGIYSLSDLINYKNAGADHYSLSTALINPYKSYKIIKTYREIYF